MLFLCRKFSIDNCLLSNVNLGFYDNLDDVLTDSQWDLYRQSNDFQCSTDSGGSGGMYKLVVLWASNHLLLSILPSIHKQNFFI